MLTPKEISQRFEVQLNTLYNWRKTKPKLYAYLQNADYNLQKSKEINILLDSYSSDFQANFLLEEIEFLISSDFEVFSIDEINNLETLFIKSNYKLIPSKNRFILDIYDNIKELNVIQKYILYKKVYKSRKDGEDLDIKDYFKEFIKAD
jgi:predicted nucleotidyltransferase